MTASKQAFLSPGAVAALRGAAPKAALGAGIGAAGGALLGGEGHRLEGALGGATLGAGVGGAAHFAPQIRETASDLRRMVMPSAETRAALKEVRSQVPSRAPASTAPSLPIRPPAANDVAGAAALDRLDMMLGKAAADGYRDVLETFGLEKTAFIAPLMAAGRTAMGAMGRAATLPNLTKGVQAANKVLEHPGAQLGMAVAPMLKGAATRAEVLAMTDPAALKQLFSRAGTVHRPDSASLPHVRMLMKDLAAGEVSPVMQALSAQAGRPAVADALSYARQHAPYDVPDLRADWLAGIRDVEGVGPRGKLPG
jgi:hypothetical protein